MRLFVAIEVPPTVRDQIQAALELLPPQLVGAGLRWVRPDAWHLTLTFLGAVEPRQVVDLTTRLGRAAGRAGALTLRISGAGRFRGNVVWAGVDGDLVPLRRLAAATGAAARRAGVDVEERAYRAHLTLARGDGVIDLRSIVTALDGLATDSWSATELLLMRSELGAGPGGTARHEVMDSWPLGRAAQPDPSVGCSEAMGPTP